MTTMRRADALVPTLEPGHAAYVIEVDGEPVGIVASGSSSRGRVWFAARPWPLRSAPWGPSVTAATRGGAVERLRG